jgi:hypothetical protein
MSRRGPGAALAAVLALAGCGGADRPRATSGHALAWTGTPHLYAHPTLRRDRILSGVVRNASSRPVLVQSRDVRVVDARGRRVRAAAIFLSSYAHRIPPFNKPSTVPGREQRLKGFVAELPPGRDVPLTVSWRLGPAPAAPVRVELGGSSLPIPAR